ncbi:hypothetical protein AHX64_20470 [Salmonella enterica subsp. enterica serovar Montevideo]|jgi:hypothetical protein|nr:hypothetical protein [Salmonella enterica]EBV4312674.1 hypothetical protein [Salmonella enterica subsp. enterica serovar Livingstone]EBZ6683743.1 hypothetical protein [Salmonella enterica subsp. enterica serovar Mbandaka]ECZ5462235.1 hypothetical protein [Salmonella enterica subsp. enterica serovar Montevideo]EDW2698440.1 hypothetical protein [Salmonella enterica subsp. enterica serovar Ohio]DAM17097.1 MAG TPA: PSHCP spectroscopy, cyanobacteria, tRNA, Tudor [Caudoviricetes sp.]
MALVKVIADNLLSGASLTKLKPGDNVEVSDSVAERWVSAGLAEVVGKQEFEVATPSGDKQKKSDKKDK